jgi:hypothetical protein
MELTLAPTGGYSDSSALYLATAALLVYGEDARPFRDDLRLDGAFVSAGHLQAFVGHNETDVVVAFRGSRSPLTADGRKDWLLTDARQLLVPPLADDFGANFAAVGEGARFHQGFLQALAALWGELFPPVEAVADGQGRTLWLAGHSFGGALAALAAWLMEQRGLSVHQVYTFGSPMFCDVVAAEGYNARLGTRVRRLVNVADLVPALPLSSLLHNEYRHVGVPEFLPADDAVGTPAVHGLLGHLRAVAEWLSAPLAVEELLWQELTRRVAAHSLNKGYISLLRARLRLPAAA